MMQQLRAYAERVNAAAARVLDAVAEMAMQLGFATDFGFAANATALGNGNTTTAWNVKPSVHTTAICTHGNGYARRLREIPT